MTFLGFLFFRQKKAIIQRTFTVHWKQYVKSVQITYFLGNITYDTYFPIKNKHTKFSQIVSWPTIDPRWTHKEMVRAAEYKLVLSND